MVGGKGRKTHLTKLHLIGCDCVGGPFLIAVVVVVVVVVVAVVFVFIPSKQNQSNKGYLRNSVKILSKSYRLNLCMHDTYQKPHDNSC